MWCVDSTLLQVLVPVLAFLDVEEPHLTNLALDGHATWAAHPAAGVHDEEHDHLNSPLGSKGDEGACSLTAHHTRTPVQTRSAISSIRRPGIGSMRCPHAEMRRITDLRKQVHGKSTPTDTPIAHQVE